MRGTINCGCQVQFCRTFTYILIKDSICISSSCSCSLILRHRRDIHRWIFRVTFHYQRSRLAPLGYATVFEIFLMCTYFYGVVSLRNWSVLSSSVSKALDWHPTVFGSCSVAYVGLKFTFAMSFITRLRSVVPKLWSAAHWLQDLGRSPIITN